MRLEQSASERDYFRVIGGKTGQLFSVSCVLGARTAGGSIAQQSQLKQFGMRIGLAFQIADDVMDLTQSTEKTGKDAANDLSNHRLTLPLIRALKLGSETERRQLRELLSSADSIEQSRLREESLVRQGIASAQATAEHFVRRALRNLEFLPSCAARETLAGIANFALHRTA